MSHYLIPKITSLNISRLFTFTIVFYSPQLPTFAKTFLRRRVRIIFVAGHWDSLQLEAGLFFHLLSLEFHAIAL